MRPFEGIRIIDATHVLAGPFAAFSASHATACSNVTSSGLISFGMVKFTLPWLT